MLKKVKNVGWAYPTSPDATRFGYAEVGCWVVEEQIGYEPPVAIAAFREHRAAVECAEGIGLPWGIYSMHMWGSG